MANIRVKDLPNTSAPAADTDEFIIDSSSAGTRRLNYGELKTAISGDFQSGTTTYKVATLGSDNKLDPAQIPDTLSQGLNFVGVANSAGDLTSTTQGDFYVIQTAFGVYSVGDQAVYDGSAYIRVTDGTKEISEGGTGATTLDDAKVNLEIANIGTSPQEAPLNQHLGSLAYQSAEAVSVAELEVESTTGTATTQALTVTDGTDTNFVVQEDGKTGIGTATPSAVTEITGAGTGGRGLKITETSASKTNGVYTLEVDSSAHGSNTSAAGAMKIDVAAGRAVTVDGAGRMAIGNSSPGSYNGTADDLVVGDAVGHRGITISSGSGNSGNIYFADGTTGTDAYRGYIGYNQSSDIMSFGTGAATQWQINSSGNLVAYSAGNGIDFGAVATSAGDGTNTTGSASNSVLSDYEFGSWTPSFSTSGAGFTTMTMEILAAQYCKVGRLVHCQAKIRTDNVDATGAGGGVLIQGLPFVSETSSDNSGTLNVGYSASWVNSPAAGYVQPGAAFVRLFRYATTGTAAIIPSDLTAGASADKNELIFTISYIAST